MQEYQTDAYEPVNFVREGIRIGAINGAFALLLMYGSYFMGIDAFVTAQFLDNFIPYMIIVLLIYGFQLRKRNGGYLSFKEGLQYAFVSYVVVALMLAVGTYILFNLVDKGLTEKTVNATIERMRSFAERMGVSASDIDKDMDKLNESKKETNLKNIVLGTGQALIWHFIKSLLIALVIRREKPVV